MAPSAPKEKPPKKLFVTLPKGARALFDQLVARKLYGDKDAEVARYLIISGLDELVERKRLVEPPSDP
jgi:hypothetical protein